MAKTETSTCPSCKETINAEALRCKHCGVNVEVARASLPSHKGTCPYCKEAIKSDAIVCYHCRSSVVGGRVGPTHAGVCPFCRESVNKLASKCRHCRADISGSPAPSVMARDQMSTGCGSECQSLDGLHKCCCSVGQKCNIYAADCTCSNAEKPGDQQIVDLLAGIDEVATAGHSDSVDAQGVPNTVVQQRSSKGRRIVYRKRCKRVPYIVCDAYGCRTEYGWVCEIYPVLV